MEKKLINNLKLKILSVFIAFFVWLAVVNISNPDITGTQNVPLEVLNESVLTSSGKTYELLDDKNTVTVSYKVRTLDSGSVSASDFRAYIDLADMYEPTGAVPIKIDVKNSHVDSVTAKPAVIRVRTEDLQQKPFELTPKYVGKPEDGYSQGSVSLSPSKIVVSGPQSLVGQISTVGIEIRLDGATEDLTGTLPIKCYDANGNEISLDDRVTLSRTEADYDQSILKVKDLSLNFETEGRVADGYRYTGIESSIKSVKVVGLKSDLAEISSITIPKKELNMDGATADKKVTIDLSQYLPKGVSLAEGESQITVTIKVEPLETRDFVLGPDSIRQVGASSHYSYQFDRDTVTVRIKGLTEDLDQLTEENLEAEVDVSDMGPGTHTAQVSLQLGAAYELVSCDPLQITVHDRTADETETAAESQDTSSRPAESESKMEGTSEASSSSAQE